jgi:tetratricopeptide (TPR) repeat protein
VGRNEGINKKNLGEFWMSTISNEKMNEEVKNVIMNEVFLGCFAKGNLGKGRKILNKLYLQYNNKINDTETRRLIIYNLAWVEYELDSFDRAKSLIKEIREVIESDGVYLSLDNKVNYFKVLNLYIEAFREEIDDEDYRWIYNYMAVTYENKKEYGEMAIALTNIYALDKEYSKIFDLLKFVVKLNNEKMSHYSQELLKEIKDSSLHNKGLELIKSKGIKIG